MRIKNGMDMVFLAVVKYLGKLIISEKGIISVIYTIGCCHLDGIAMLI